MQLWRTVANSRASLSGKPFSLAVGAHIPAIASLPPSICACKRFTLEVLGGSMVTMSTHALLKFHSSRKSPIIAHGDRLIDF